jgi:16S rRNA (cytosine1402-N4)-methyltransferase
MSAEVLFLLNPQDNLTYVDATFGAGGHSKSILEKSKSCNVIGIDRDEAVQPFADALTIQYGERFKFIAAKFSEIALVIDSQVDGFLFDIGVSSMQINTADRGFSFMRDGPLAMTMGKNQISAYDVINTYRESHLAEIILKYGDERAAPKIAEAICSHRKSSPISTTLQLAEIVKSVVYKTGKIHPATLTFQAIRVYVNDELSELEVGLEHALEKVAVGGKVILITFQGLEDKIVKNILKKYTHRVHQNKFKTTEISNAKVFDNLINGTLKPSREETRRNPRARSAKIRAVIRLK